MAGIYTSQQWLPNPLYQINQIHTLDSESIYISGYYRKLGQDNMLIGKIRLSKTTSLVEKNQAQLLKIYPNPVRQSMVYFQFPNTGFPETMQLTLRDMQGRTVLSSLLAKPELEAGIQLPPSLANGMYVLELTWNKERAVHKLLIQN